jgi:glycosyltransferase involved in cell wall biosynthesis
MAQRIGPELTVAAQSKAAPRDLPIRSRDDGVLRVLHCLWAGEIGGAERAVYQLVREQIRDPSLEPALLFAQARGQYASAAFSLGCSVVDLALSSGRALHRIPTIADSLRDFDIHHFHSAEPLVMLGSVFCKKATRVYTHRGGFTRYTTLKRMRYKTTGVLIRRYFHGVSGNTAHGAHSGAKLCGLDPAAVMVTYNGLDLELLTPQRSAALIRAELGIGEEDFVVGTAATLKPWKRINLLIDLVARIPNSKLRLLIVGDGTQRRSLEAQTRSLGVEPKVSFVGVQACPADYLQVMDAFCLPSTALESFGNAVVEAMAMGIPSIVFADSPGVTEHIEPDRTGFIASDQRQLAEIVERLMADPSLRKRIGQEAEADIRSRYTPMRAAQSYKRLYVQAMASKTARHWEAR